MRAAMIPPTSRWLPARSRENAVRLGRTKLAGVPESSRAVSRVLAAAGAAVLTAGLAGGLAGCAKFDSALGQQWVTVDFQSNTSIATMLKVRAACAHIPNVVPEALPRDRTPVTMNGAVTYQTNNASDANLAQLQQCLQRFPSVAGMDPEDSGEDGG
jgi:hypothetical protein